MSWTPKCTVHRMGPCLLLLLLVADERVTARPEWTSTVELRVAPAFQLNLGGFYDPGPSLQTRFTSSVKRVFRRDDRITLIGLQAVSQPTRNVNWWASLSYQTRIAQTGKWRWEAAGGIERWRFPSVLRTGTQDWVGLWTLSSQRPTRRAGLWTAIADGRTTLHSNVPRGTILLLQLQGAHTLWDGERARLTVQHGPVYAHAWRIYGVTNGPRIFRYAATATWSQKRDWAFEAGLRPQSGLGPRVPDFLYWHFGVVYRLH